MLQVRLICVGKLKEKFYQEACREYEKRLSGLCRLEIVQLEEAPDRPGGLALEGTRIREVVLSGSYVIALCIEGESLSSQGLADRLRRLQNSGVSRLCLIIGSSRGLEEEVKQQANLRLSMSSMTFPHHLARVMVLEQLYRGLSILNGSKYHK